MQVTWLDPKKNNQINNFQKTFQNMDYENLHPEVWLAGPGTWWVGRDSEFHRRSEGSSCIGPGSLLVPYGYSVLLRDEANIGKLEESLQ